MTKRVGFRRIVLKLSGELLSRDTENIAPAAIAAAVAQLRHIVFNFADSKALPRILHGDMEPATVVHDGETIPA